MKQTSLKQKLLLVIFGTFLAVIFLEAGLRLAGAFVLYLQERHNHLTFNQNEYRILCLGESTTALGGEDSYPSQLEEMLNAQGGTKKFTVINKGIISTTTDYILAHLDENLDRYKPQLVIVMMGINDKIYLHGTCKSLWWENIKLYFKDLRVYKLAHLLYEHIDHRIKEIKAPVKVVDLTGGDDHQRVEDLLKSLIVRDIERIHRHMSALLQYRQQGQLGQVRQEAQFARESVMEAVSASVELARRYRLAGGFQDAQYLLEQAAVLDPDDPDVYQQWGELYLAQGKSSKALIAFQAAHALAPKNSDVLLGLAHAYYQEHNDEAFLVYAGYLKIQPQDYWGFVELAQWLKENKHFDQAEQYLEQAIKIMPGSSQAYADLGQIYKEEGREDLAKKNFKKVAELEMSDYRPVTLVNYSLLLNKVLDRHIKLIVMQYPLRSMVPLENYLGEHKGVIFLENRKNFKQALGQGGYWHYFKDSFAHDFGHCTRAGNELIVHNLAEVIK